MDTKQTANSLGYIGRAYAQSLSEFGEVIDLPRSGGCLLKRVIPGTNLFDAMGPYPLFCCNDWTALPQDIEDLANECVSVALVTDPFGNHNQEVLKQSFDIINPFKKHFVVELNRPIAEIGSKHHRKTALNALKKIQIEPHHNPPEFAEEWSNLYKTIVNRYSIHGIRAFSLDAFRRQLEVPGVDVLIARNDDQIIGAQIYYIQDNVAHCHLGAVTERGYELGAFYAMDYQSFTHFSGRVVKVDLGGGAGVEISESDGLSRYKGGWASIMPPVWFCGKIMNKKKYNELVKAHNQEHSPYFPAYRTGEFE